MSCSLVAEDFTDEYMIKLDGSGSDAVLSSVAPTTSARLRLARIPELVSMIFNFAMQADGNEIVMPWITGDRTNAGIVTGLLAVNHDIYHQCRNTLYRDNDFIVDHYGSGLQYLSQAMGVDSCRRGCDIHPAIRSIRLVIGCHDHDWKGVWKTEMFIQALRDMPCRLTVSRLRVDLAPFCFFDNKDLAQFADVLKDKFKVTTSFEFYGSDVHWLWDLRILPKALRMKLQPTNVEFCYHKDDLQLVGWFDHYYEPADNENERLGLGAEGEELEIRDGKYYYENRQDFLFGVESEPYYGF